LLGAATMQTLLMMLCRKSAGHCCYYGQVLEWIVSYQQCSDGTWANCKGFSCYGYVNDTASAACWWVTSTTSFSYDDGEDGL
jgi:hypothetical protein